MRPPLSQLVKPLIVLAVVMLPGETALAQKGKPVPEFTRQRLLITNFAVGAGADLRLGRRAADGVRSRVAKAANKVETDVISGDGIRLLMMRVGIDPDTTYLDQEIYAMGRYLRADEYLRGTVSIVSGGIRLAATLVLVRDKRLRQPLPVVTAAKLDDATDMLAKHIAGARAQLVQQRRCENALRAGSGSRALVSAREGVALYPSSTLARTCLVWALRATNAQPSEVLSVARQVLAIDSGSFHALESAALALDSLHQRQNAASMWLRLAATDTADLELALRVIFSLVSGGSAELAEPYVLRLTEAHPDNLPLVQQKWRVTYETRNWKRVVEAGEYLAVRDTVARTDSTFWLRFATAYKAAERPFKAIETLAYAVSSFPNDPRIYSLYTQYVKAEADTVIGRGLARFPQSAQLLALNAKELRTRGKLEESLDASKRALAFDSTMAQGELMVAQLEVELGRPDSALSSLRRALARGEDSSVVAQFALSKGNALYRAANGTHMSTDFGVALRFLALADTLRSSVQSRFLIGATALGLAQAALTEAPKVADKSASCRLARLGAEMIPIARAGLLSGQEAYADAAKQSLDYLGQLDPFVGQQLAAFCQQNPPR